MSLGPYDTQKNPNHPGVKGEAYHTGPIGGVIGKVDCPGTGTFPPEQQGVINKAQPAGISGTNQHVNPVNLVMITQGIGVVPDTNTGNVLDQPIVPGVNEAIGQVEENSDGENKPSVVGSEEVSSDEEDSDTL